MGLSPISSDMTAVIGPDDPRQRGGKLRCATIGNMQESAIEPGLLKVFRVFVGLRLLLILITIPLQAILPRQRVHLYLILILLEAGVLLIYLSWTWLQRTLGRAYLPVAIIYAACSSIIEQSLIMLMRQADLLQGDAATRGFIGLMVLLLVPLMLVSWQYRLRHVLIFILGTSLFELALTIPLSLVSGLDTGTLIGLVIVRALLFGLIGSVINHLVTEARAQRLALASANAELARQAAMIERLAVTQERNRLARELHDTLAHTLSGLAVQLEAVRSTLQYDPGSAGAMVAKSLETARQGLKESRRAIQALRASPLEEQGLSRAIARLAEAAAKRGNLQLDLEVPGHPVALPAKVEQAIYRIGEEALNNVIHHADASSLQVRLRALESGVMLQIVDDGVGFEPAASADSDRYGLQGMRERAQEIGAQLFIESLPGQGTVLQVELGG
jgi:signal transduction histidine kinase